MNFWKKLWGAGSPQDAGRAAPEPEPSLARRQAGQDFGAFVALLAQGLEPGEAQRLRQAAGDAWQQATQALAAEGAHADVDAFEVLQEIMAGDEGQRPGQWLILFVDWRASDEIGWQAAELVGRRRAGLAWDGAEAEFESVPHAFAALAAWLAGHGLALLHIETDADAYCAAIVDAAEAAPARRLAEAAGLTVYDPQEFAARN